MAGYEDFVNLNYKSKDTDLIASFKVKVPKWETKERSIGAVASESSVGTWSSVKAMQYEHLKKVAAKFFEINKDGWIKIAYPEDHFEEGNMSQILASIAGNVFGMKAVEALRLQDIKWTKKIIKSFPGPQFGKEGIKKIFKIYNRPIMLSVAKPKVGMTTEEHAKVGYDIWRGGLDLLKDDENLTNQHFNPFEKRVKLRDKVEK
jgi:ribulose-bisphosphate carboxylase large chain